jgi:hypothetical protein
VGLGDFVKPTTLLGSTGNLTDSLPSTEAIPFSFDTTSLIQAIVNQGTMHFVGFHLEGPSSDSQAWVWGLGAPDPAERPQLDVTFSAASVPEPPAALLLGLGLVSLSILAWWRTH